MNVYFLSDTHLGAPYYPDSKVAEKRVVDFLDSIKEEAYAIFLLGDILDYWYEYRYVVPRGFVRFFGKLAELSDRGIRIVWLIGNHDIWIFDYLPKELGIEVIDGSVTEVFDGHKFFMTHGDGIGNLPPKFRFLRALFRNKFCQKLFSSIHPRWTIPFAYNWSNHSRGTSSLPTEKNAARMYENFDNFSKEMLEANPDISYFIFGHIHLLRQYPITVTLPEERSATAEIVVLGEWISQFSYALWNGTTLSLHHAYPPTI